MIGDTVVYESDGVAFAKTRTLTKKLARSLKDRSHITRDSLKIDDVSDLTTRLLY
jgi:rRNA maturation protein Rpf1